MNTIAKGLHAGITKLLRAKALYSLLTATSIQMGTTSAGDVSYFYITYRNSVRYIDRNLVITIYPDRIVTESSSFIQMIDHLTDRQRTEFYKLPVNWNAELFNLLVERGDEYERRPCPSEILEYAAYASTPGFRALSLSSIKNISNRLK